MKQNKTEGQYKMQRVTRAWLSGEQEAAALWAELLGLGGWAEHHGLDVRKCERSERGEGPGNEDLISPL